MNKSNKILLGVLSFVVVCVVGYALFSETITVTGTASANGSYELTTTCHLGMTNEILQVLGAPSGTSGDIMQGGYKNDNCDVSNGKVTMSTEFLYPSASRFFTIVVENTGTIDAVLPTSVENLYDLKQELKIYNLSDDTLVSTHYSGNDFWRTAIYYAHFVEFGDGSLIAGMNENGELSPEQDELNSIGMMVKDSQGNSYIRLKPKEKLFISIPADWDSRAVNTNHYSKVTATVEFPFSQITNDMVEVSDGVIDIY